MLVYFGLKYKELDQNMTFIEKLYYDFMRIGIDLYCVEKELEKYGSVHLLENELMLKTFEVIDKSDIVLIDITEKGVGLGIECGYAYANKKPIYLIAKKGVEISKTIKGIANNIVYYETNNDIIRMFSK
jgi:2'-deoxynucleoside 5'-phosphate N-hydrolase